MKDFFGYRDPLMSGHAAADRILEKKQREAELAEADLHSEESTPLEVINQNVKLDEDEDKETPAKEYYERFEQFRDAKNRLGVPMKDKEVSNNKKSPGKYLTRKSQRAFDSYK